MPNDRVMGLSIGNFTSDSSCYERMYASNSEISLVIVFLRLREKKCEFSFVFALFLSIERATRVIIQCLARSQQFGRTF